MKYAIFGICLMSLSAFAETIPMKCGEPDEQAVFDVIFNVEAETVTVNKNGLTLCENTAYAFEGEIFDYGEGEAIFYCDDIGYTYDNRYDETVLYVDGMTVEFAGRTWKEEFFCYDDM